MEEVRRERGQGGDESDAAKTLGDDMSSGGLLTLASTLLFDRGICVDYHHSSLRFSL